MFKADLILPNITISQMITQDQMTQTELLYMI